MIQEKDHTDVGIASLIFGILGFFCYFIGMVFYSFVENRLYGIVIGLLLGIIALVLGYVAKKKGDSYGTYGMLLGGLIVILVLLTVVLTTPVYVETSYSS